MSSVDNKSNTIHVSVNGDHIKVYEIQNKRGTMINFDVNVKNQLTETFVKQVTCEILVRVNLSAIERVEKAII